MLCLAAFAFVFTVVGISVASNSGPAEIVLKTSTGKKPAFFPHKAHQDMMECATCHHTKNADGNRGAYVAGEEKACLSCHDDKGFKDNAHNLCKGCHKDGYNGKKGPTKCGDCHKKDL
ncbi:MAG: cytochrome c family protein [Proteobacteria bacterium]|nr:cytochrome c family protein [Pseudomonadota bacterium]MBU1688221.1 cytochrome c family protein [Pseudomonadota bacterium]